MNNKYKHAFRSWAVVTSQIQFEAEEVDRIFSLEYAFLFPAIREFDDHGEYGKQAYNTHFRALRSVRDEAELVFADLSLDVVTNLFYEAMFEMIKDGSYLMPNRCRLIISKMRDLLNAHNEKIPS